jgi:hypothetical protein
MKKLLVTAALAAALAAPAPALAAETAYVASGTLTYTSELGQADAVTVGDGNGSYAGRHYLTESMSPSGTSGAGCTPLSGYPTVVCDGVTRFDVATLDQNDLVSVLSALPTRIDAGDGDDFVTGGAGPDTVDGGAGADDIATGGGDDRIAARDGSVDTIDCGAGDDRADADAFDVVKNCETDPVPVTGEQPVTPVDDKPEGGAPGDAPDAGATPLAVEPALPALPAASPVALVAKVVQVGRDGIAPIELSCAATEVAGCAGDVFLDPARQGKALGHRKAKGKARSKAKVRAQAARRGRFGRSPFQIAAGKKQSLSVKLTPEARNRLGLPKGKKARAARRGRRVKAKVTVVQKGKKPVAMVIELRG